MESGVYKIDCMNCDKFYIGETGRSLKTRIKEHQNDIKYSKPASGIVEHTHNMGHQFDFKKTNLIFPNSNKSKRHIIESSAIISNKQNCVNLNNGFVDIDNFISKHVCKTFDLERFFS